MPYWGLSTCVDIFAPCYRAQQLVAMAERDDPNVFEILICQISKDGKINVAL
jgi:hypothetical protein